MSVVVVGLSHRTAPLDLLERMTITRSHLPKCLADLSGREFVSEAVILSTCHRTEIYAVAERFHGAMHDVRNFLAETTFVALEDFADHLYSYYDEAAASHLFGLAAGVDSVILGESQIVGQIRDAWQAASDEGAAGPRLAGLFRHALEVGKRSRSETRIARGVTSLSQAAVALATSRLGTLEDRKIVVLGAGEMGEGMVADAMSPAVRVGPATNGPAANGPAAKGPAEVVVASRTRSRAAAVAERVGARAVSLDEVLPALADADVLLSCTGSDSVVLNADDLEAVVANRQSRPLLIVDLGMPRDIDPAVATLSGVTLLDLTDIRRFADVGLDQRRQEVGRVQKIVAAEVARYLDAVTEREAAPTITALRGWAEAVRRGELDRYRSRLDGLDDDQREAVEGLTRAMLAKVLHEPTVRLKDAAGSARGERLSNALRELFDL